MSIWVVDEGGRLLGWTKRSALARAPRVDEALVRMDPSEAGILDDATMKEALSHAVAEGFRALPVVDREGRLVGELTLETFAKVTDAEPTFPAPGDSAPTPSDGEAERP